MGKQAIDDFVQPSSQSAKNVLDNGQVALIETRMAKVAGGLSRVKGNMVKLAIFTSGGNQEDAVDMSKASRDRGLFLVTRFRPERDQQSNKSKGFTGETFERPNSGTTVGMQYSPTDHLMEDNGLAHLGTLVQTGNIVIGKTTALRSKKGTRKAADTTTTTTTTAATTTENGNDSDPENAGDGNGHGHGGRGRERVPTKRDISLIHQGDEAVISNAMKTTTLTGEQNVKIETRQTREILVGDKLQAHSQKATISRIVPMEDLPWSEVDGTVADIYVHPISELARRTGGHLAELLMSKVVALRPSQARRLGLIDGTPFARISRRRDQDAGGSLLADPWPCEFDDILNDVKKAYGFDVVEHDGYIPFHFLRTGKERFRCGMTGRVIDCLVMVGIIQMHRLLQFVMDKIYAAYTAQKTILLQYRGGRADQGGMRVGSMEVDVLAAHGVAFIMYESLVTLADPVELYFCRHCGIMCLVVVDSRSSCSVCNKEGVAVVVKTVEGFRSFLFNLAAMNVLTRLNLKTVPRGLVK
jgi:DNA-directed RNA polymerase beta subunit